MRHVHPGGASILLELRRQSRDRFHRDCESGFPLTRSGNAGGFSARAQAATAVHAAGPASSRRFGQIFGLDPRVAFLTLIVDLMLNAGDVATMGLLLPVSIAAGVVLGYVAYRAQINWYGDDKESARIKAIVLGLLTAIPTPLPELLYIPAGLVGLLHGFWRREPRT